MFPIGTQLKKDFPPYGTYVGEIKSFDGVMYRVYYPEDDDEEDIYEDELRTLMGVTRPDHSSSNMETQSAESPEQPDQENTVESAKPRYTVGTTFAKVFPGYGTFMGRIEFFDGVHYNVFYPRDGDREDLTEAELDELKILSKG